jgi:TonB-linked SusC/RagA family outer membrane protein
MQKILLACCLAMISYGALAQRITVTGMVTTEDNVTTLPGASVLVKGTTTGTTTDANGTFTIQVDNADNILVISFICYEEQEITVGNRTQINVSLIPDLTTLNEVVVVGYGTQEKTNLTGAVSTFKTDELENRPITQTSQALQGKMAGVTVMQGFGLPGSDASNVRIRGVGTIYPTNDNTKVEPLVLIDGVQGNLNEINPRDIEQISVLKDAASSSIYGSRAANGVIVITTKRGKNEPISILYSAQYGVQRPTYLPEPVDGITHITLKNEQDRNQGRAELFSPDVIQTYKDNVGTEPYFDTDWYGAAMKKQAMQYQHNVTVRGGTEKLSALVALSYLNQDGLIENARFDRKTLRFNTDYKATNKLSIALDGSLYLQDQRYPSRGDQLIFEMMAEIPQIYPAVWGDGVWGEGWNGDNPLGYIYEGGATDRSVSRTILNLHADYQFTDWLSAEVRYSPKFLSTYGTSMVQKYSFRAADGSTGTRPNGNNSLNNLYNRTVENFFQGLLRFNKISDRHTISAIAGFEALDNKYVNFDASRQNFLLDDYQVLSGGDANFKDNNGGATEFALLSYLGRVNYSFNGKYLLEGNIRYDGSSRFAMANRWGFFPSFSAGWNISEENFMKAIETITALKLRASWGRLGNQNIGNYPYQGLISVNQPLKTVPYFFGKSAVNAAAQTILPNSDVTWETTEDLNFGIDFGIFKNRLTGSFDIYKRNTYDILYTRDIPAVIGLRPSEQNIAEVENKGWDLQISWDDNIRGLDYGIDVVVSDVSNKVISLAGKPVYGRNAVLEGEEYQSYYGYETIGIYRSAEDVAAYPRLNAAVNIGDLIFKDQNNDGIIDPQSDRTVLGSSIPRWNYGFTLRLGYKNFDFNIFLQGVGKKNVYYNVYDARYGGTYYAYQLNRLNPSDQSTWQTATRPRLMDAGSANNQDNSFHLYNAAYLRCKSIVLGYNVPTALTERIRLAGLRVYVTAQNLFTVDNLDISTIDPEAPDTNQFGTSYYPNTKTFVAGLEVKF